MTTTTTLQPARLPNVSKPDAFRDLGPVDIAQIGPLILSLPEKLWEVEDSRKENKFPCFHHTRHIVFRFIEGNRDPRVYYSHPIWTVWQKKLLPLFDKIVAPYGYERPVYPKVMLARLSAGYEIDRHVDGGGSNLCTHKIHIPIQTNPKALFTTNDQTQHLSLGNAYEVNNIAPHAVENFGATDRIHLVFEVFDEAD